MNSFSSATGSSAGDRRPSGLPLVGDVPWGSHLCQLYRSKDELAKSLVAYFEAGLAAGEHCVWVAAEPLCAAECREALGRAVPDLDARVGCGQIEIRDHRDWYRDSAGLAAGALVEGWLAREQRALGRGYAGLRIAGSLSWLKPGDWAALGDYEAAVHQAFSARKILALCSYSLAHCGPEGIVDVLRTHPLALVSRGRTWQLIHSATLVHAGVNSARDAPVSRRFAAGPPGGREHGPGARAPRAAEHLARLRRVTSALAEAATHADVARVVGTELRAVMGADQAILAVPVEEGEKLLVLGHSGVHPGTPSELGTFAIEADLPVAAAYRTGRPLSLSPAAATRQRFGGGTPASVCQSVVCMPLTLGTRRLGAICLGWRRTRRMSPGERALLDELARQVALAVERARLCEDARAERTRAEDAGRAKDEFLAMLGHELRNPLSPILTALQIMQLRGGDQFARERAVIERQAHHMVRLVDDLLDVSRIARGKVELERAPVELSEVVSRAIDMASPLLEERAHALHTEVPAGLVVTGDVHRLAQVVANLLTNAAKYTPPGGSIEVRAGEVRAGEVRAGEVRAGEVRAGEVRAGAGEDTVELTVADSGVGIDAELLPHVFDLFAQGRQSLDRSKGGLGLGLAIVRALVEAHGGSVRARSEGKDRGSAFTISLPRARAPAAPGARADPGNAGPQPQRARTPRRILVVDDNRDAAAALDELLRAVGHITRVAHDGPGALAAARTFRPEIALLDIGLPVMDGYELGRRLRDLLPDAPPVLVAVTGYGQRSDRARSARAGFADHLVKPVDLARLESALGRLAPATECSWPDPRP